MPTVLGLDLGTNSIGWCLVEAKKRIIATGVRIFPVGVKEDDFLKTGKEISKNVARRMARSARRRRHRYKMRRTQLTEILRQLAMLPTDEDFFSTRELYELRAKGLDSRISLVEFGRILMMLNKRRGFKSSRKILGGEEAKKEEGKVKTSILELQTHVEHAKCRTVGEYFWKLFQETAARENWPNRDEAIERIRGRFVGREMYLNEFDRLWEAQSGYYPTVLTPELRSKIRDEIIYYQRNLKSAKGFVAPCRFEPGKRCAARSSQQFQEFRIWQQLSAVRFASGERVGDSLSVEEKKKAAIVLERRKKMTASDLKKVLGLQRSVSFNDVFDLIGNTTNARLISVIGEDFFNDLSQNQLFELWHILSYTDNTDKLKNIVRRKISQGLLPPMSEESIDAYAEINLEEGYGSLSTKALNKILPQVREGFPPYDAFVKAGYDPTRKLIRGQLVELQKLPPLAPNELRNPIVQQMLSETFRVVNAIVAKYGKPDMIRVELARELKKPRSMREEDRYRAVQTRKRREDYADFLTEVLRKKIEPSAGEVRKYELWLEMGCEDPKLDALESFLRNGRVLDAKKYRLWKECGRISPYSGKVISLTKLFSPEIQIEHILPYSKTMSNEFTNLCLCEATINKDKGDTLPFEYFDAKGEKALQAFKNRVAVFGMAKKRRFLAREVPEGFLNSQLNNTSYAARELASRLEMLLPPVREKEILKPRVQVVSGNATGILRRLWGLNSILSRGDIDTKNRGDHRHHAIDALVVACTTPGVVHDLTRYSKFDILNKLTNDRVAPPWRNFLNDTAENIFQIIISYRSQKRLVGRKPNEIVAKNRAKYPEGFLRKVSQTIRGPLHEETIYGHIQVGGESSFVTRWPLSRFTKVEQLEKVVDDKVREVLLKRVKKYNGDLRKAFAEDPEDPLLMHSEKDVSVTIKRVRVKSLGEHLVEVRPGAFVETGNNYRIAIYEDPVSKERDYETVRFWDAVQRKMNGLPAVLKMKDGKPLLFSLSQRETVVMYRESADEIDWGDSDYLRRNLFRVRKFDVNGTIVLDYLYAAKLNDKEDRKRVPPLVIQTTAKTLRCVRVEVDYLGVVVKREGNAV